jgi:hypothetical protein
MKDIRNLLYKIFKHMGVTTQPPLAAQVAGIIRRMKSVTIQPPLALQVAGTSAGITG